MREALAANHDLLLDDDRREQKRRAGRGKAKPGLATRLFGGRRRAVVFLSFVALAAIGVPLNALYLQDGRHPAPLFQKAEVEPDAPATRALAERPHAEPPAAPRATPRSIEPAADAPVVKPLPAKAEPARSAEKRHGDSIGALLSGHAQKPAEAEKTVKLAQQALAKLGYSVHTDGVMGASTRRALEKFARANGLPANGEIDAVLLRKLRARAAATQAPAPVPPAPPPAPHARTN